MKYDVFISYRREGGFDTAKHLNDLLSRDGYRVSFDIDTLRNGDFDVQLLERIEECTDFILIIDPNAFDRTLDPTSDRNKDWMRIELAHALKHKKNIVPVFLAGITTFPEGLPDDIASVVTKNGPEFNKYYFDDFYKKLKSRFLKSRNRKSFYYIIFIMLLLIGGLFAYNLVIRDAQEFVTYKNPSDAQITTKEQFDKYVLSNIGNLCSDSLDLSKDLDWLLEYWKVFADNGDAEAQYNVGLLYYLSNNSIDHKKAIKYFQKAADQDYPQALYSLAVCYYNAIYINKDLDKATELFYKSAIQNYAPAQNDYPISFYEKSDNRMEPSEIFEWFEKSAKQDYAPAQYHLSCCYSRGIGVSPDIDLYYYWMKKSADQHYDIARYNLAGFYLFAQDEYKDLEEGFDILDSLVKEEFVYAYYNLAQCYANGIVVDKDLDKAFELIKDGANRKDPVAIYALGCNYFQPYPGTVTLDYKKGLELLHQAAEYGYPLAQYYIGIAYQKGLGVKKNIKKAQKWFDIAAMQNVNHQTVNAFNNQRVTNN